MQQNRRWSLFVAGNQDRIANSSRIVPLVGTFLRYHELDAPGRIVRINLTAPAMLGYTVEEMVQKPVHSS
jgi:hypothetical protein